MKLCFLRTAAYTCFSFYGQNMGWVEVREERIPCLYFGYFGSSVNFWSCFISVSIPLPKGRWRPCGHTVLFPCQLQTSSQFLWSPFPQIRFLPARLTISYSAFHHHQLVSANGWGHCLRLHMIFIQKRQTLTQTRPTWWTLEVLS